MLGQYHAARWVEAKNVGATAIPAFGVLRITEATLENPGRTVLHVIRPRYDSESPTAINSFKPIAAGDYGLVAVEGCVFALYDDTDTPSNGELWGPQANSYELKQGNAGFIIYGAEDTDRDIVLVDLSARPGNLIGGCLAQDHPGRGIAFNIHLGTWNPAQDKWAYAPSATVKAIDWRYGVPYGDEGTTGLFEPRQSTTWGVIYECVALDCATPGPCGS